MIGIALFTYHKYRKTIDSDVVLDEHGNMIQFTGENLNGEATAYDRDVELTTRLRGSRPLGSSVRPSRLTLLATDH